MRSETELSMNTGRKQELMDHGGDARCGRHDFIKAQSHQILSHGLVQAPSRILLFQCVYIGDQRG